MPAIGIIKVSLCPRTRSCSETERIEVLRIMYCSNQLQQRKGRRVYAEPKWWLRQLRLSNGLNRRRLTLAGLLQLMRGVGGTATDKRLGVRHMMRRKHGGG